MNFCGRRTQLLQFTGVLALGIGDALVGFVGGSQTAGEIDKASFPGFNRR
jgi:hypothetical protein